MFDRIAGVYDLMNSAMTAGLHHQWRERAVDRAGRPRLRRARHLLRHRRPGPRAARRIGPDGRWSAATSPSRCWSSPREERRGGPAGRVRLGGRARLPYGDASFDAVTIGFGARNLADLDRGLSEMARVLRPGGRLVILEITRAARSRWRASTRSGSTGWCP